eukprot:TRINITY_DN1773_c0_g1_i10.p1 TRINITY_DN1773_c0_g1~~TRINITY_DN1773_c0_g1_i10.p1  ORF type:complete len:232 (-),score=40.11 TRINITY_DN1773_c0_g1_i10:54-749(-)
MWRLHILDTKNYVYDCERLCKKMIHHDPDDNNLNERYHNTLQYYTYYFGESSTKYWPTRYDDSKADIYLETKSSGSGRGRKRAYTSSKEPKSSHTTHTPPTYQTTSPPTTSSTSNTTQSSNTSNASQNTTSNSTTKTTVDPPILNPCDPQPQPEKIIIQLQPVRIEGVTETSNFKMKPTSPLSLIFERFLAVHNLSNKDFRLVYKGLFIDLTATPFSLKLKENDLLQIVSV